MSKKATVTIRELSESKTVSISSDSKPDITETTISKWQALIDTVAKVIDVPSGLIMRLNDSNIEVFVKSKTAGNPYELHEKTELIHGLYCETVIGTQKPLIVSDAKQSETWKNNNPDLAVNMISYMGVPINWPDGECFGTVCVLDSKENRFNKNFEELINQAKQHIELDLELILKTMELKLKSKFLSLISHDIKGNIGSVNQYLEMINADYDSFKPSGIKEALQSMCEVTAISYQTLNDLLQWSKNDILQQKASFENVHIKKVIDELFIFFRHNIQKKSLHAKTQFISDSTVVYTDIEMIKLILRNLISNAIKFNKVDGEIRISVIQENQTKQITVQDTGIGMSKEYLDSLFKSNVKQKLGTLGESSNGIGLILVQDFVNKLGGSIHVESQIDKGTKFKISLPMQ